MECEYFEWVNTLKDTSQKYFEWVDTLKDTSQKYLLTRIDEHLSLHNDNLDPGSRKEKKILTD